MIEIYIIVVINLLTFLGGYLLGKNTSYLSTNINTSSSLSNLLKNKPKVNNSISIDDKKVVLNIDTDGLEKKYDSLGDKTTSITDINASINKLKNLKK